MATSAPLAQPRASSAEGSAASAMPSAPRSSSVRNGATRAIVRGVSGTFGTEPFDRARGVDRFARVEGTVDEICRAARPDPRRRSRRAGRHPAAVTRVPSTVSNTGRNDVPRRIARSDESAQIDAKFRQFRRMTAGARIVVEAQARMARETKERAGQRALRVPAGERFLHGFVAHQFAIEFVPVVMRRRIHHRDDRLRVAHRTAQARRIEHERCGEARSVRRRENRPHRTRARLLSFRRAAPAASRGRLRERLGDVSSSSVCERTVSSVATTCSQMPLPPHEQSGRSASGPVPVPHSIVTSREPRASRTVDSTLRSSTARNNTRLASTSDIATRTRSRANHEPIDAGKRERHVANGVMRFPVRVERRRDTERCPRR